MGPVDGSLVWCGLFPSFYVLSPLFFRFLSTGLLIKGVPRHTGTSVASGIFLSVRTPDPVRGPLSSARPTPETPRNFEVLGRSRD